MMEIIVVVLVSALVMLALMFFVNASTKNYQISSKEVELQMESQVAINRIHDIFLEATEYVYYGSGSLEGTLLLAVPDKEGITTTGQGVRVVTTYYVISVYENELLLSKETRDQPIGDVNAYVSGKLATMRLDTKNYLLARNVVELVVEPGSGSISSGRLLVNATIKLELHGTEFISTIAVTLRNGII